MLLRESNLTVFSEKVTVQRQEHLGNFLLQQASQSWINNCQFLVLVVDAFKIFIESTEAALDQTTTIQRKDVVILLVFQLIVFDTCEMSIQYLPVTKVLVLFRLEEFVNLVHKPRTVYSVVIASVVVVGMRTEFVSKVERIVHHKHTASCLSKITRVFCVVESLTLQRVDQTHDEETNEGFQFTSFFSHVRIPRQLPTLGNRLVGTFIVRDIAHGTDHVACQVGNTCILGSIC
mmetsp:Transcript_10800/g.26124  ORF Transcript_10800/g.26124 Transcript_10800/m.26124 type:complete len:233 (-) Transcript_10800:1656-2354(-)